MLRTVCGDSSTGNGDHIYIVVLICRNAIIAVAGRTSADTRRASGTGSGYITASNVDAVHGATACGPNTSAAVPDANPSASTGGNHGSAFNGDISGGGVGLVSANPGSIGTARGVQRAITFGTIFNGDRGVRADAYAGAAVAACQGVLPFSSTTTSAPSLMVRPALPVLELLMVAFSRVTVCSTVFSPVSLFVE